ncbi:MAG: hypothetical protein WC635_11300 [Bacteriovorax sp.]|jgi:hypothetical protein
MKLSAIIFCLLFSFAALSETKLSVDLAIDKLQYQKPPKGVGKAGSLIFKSANVNNNGIVLNVNNVNKIFDSQIFVRPTFLGFTTQFGDYGFSLEPNSVINSVNQTELLNSKLILDDNQLNVSGEFLSFINIDSSIKLRTFRLYCQNLSDQNSPLPSDSPANDMVSNCFRFLTLNGNYAPNNEAAILEFENKDKDTGDKLFLNAEVRSFDVRKNQVSANFKAARSVSNDSYFISADNLNLSCAKDEDLKEMDLNKIKKACLNELKIAPLKASIVDKAAKTNFNLDIKDLTVLDKIAYFTLNSGSFSDTVSTTTISNLMLNFQKETETDLLDLIQVLKDCISYTRLSIAEIKNTKPDEKDSAVKNILVNSSNGALLVHAEAKYLGIKAKVTITGRIALDEAQRQLNITVTDARLPMGINSVKLLMYFLKKTIVSKNISINSNIITVSL